MIVYILPSTLLGAATYRASHLGRCLREIIGNIKGLLGYYTDLELLNKCPSYQRKIRPQMSSCGNQSAVPIPILIPILIPIPNLSVIRPKKECVNSISSLRFLITQALIPNCLNLRSIFLTPSLAFAY